jgi:hypothetical protein
MLYPLRILTCDFFNILGYNAVWSGESAVVSEKYIASIFRVDEKVSCFHRSARRYIPVTAVGISHPT